MQEGPNLSIVNIDSTIGYVCTDVLDMSMRKNLFYLMVSEGSVFGGLGRTSQQQDHVAEGSV